MIQVRYKLVKYTLALCVIPKIGSHPLPLQLKLKARTIHDMTDKRWTQHVKTSKLNNNGLTRQPRQNIVKIVQNNNNIKTM